MAAGFSEDYLATERTLGLRDHVPKGAVPGAADYSGDNSDLGLLPRGTTAGGFFQRKALPTGTERKTHKGYEVVDVPAPAKPRDDPAALVKVSTLPDWTQLAFKGIARLNRLQSSLFQAAFHSNDNLLVCAPTGAGKTNVAMLTVCHEIGNNFRQGVLQKDAFKIIYVAPMKALAQEVVKTFGARLKPLGISVRELTGERLCYQRACPCAPCLRSRRSHAGDRHHLCFDITIALVIVTTPTNQVTCR